MKQIAYLILALAHTVAGLAMVGGIADGIVDAADPCGGAATLRRPVLAVHGCGSAAP